MTSNNAIQQSQNTTEEERIDLLHKLKLEYKIEDDKDLIKKLNELNHDENMKKHDVETDLIAIKSKDAELKKEIDKIESHLKDANEENNKLNVNIQTKKLQYEKHANLEKNVMEEIKISMKNYLDVRRYKKIKGELDKESESKKQSSEGSAAVLVRYIETDIFSRENEQKSEVNIDFKNQVFFVTKNKRIEDVFKEALRFFEIDKGDEKQIIPEEGDDKAMKESKPRNRAESKAETKQTRFIGVDKEAENNIVQNDAEHSKKQSVKSDYILTDNKHNDQKLLFNVRVMKFFETEDYQYMVFYLRKKNISQKMLLSDQEESVGINDAQKSMQNEKSTKVLKDFLENDVLKQYFPGMKNYIEDKKYEAVYYETSFKKDFPRFLFNLMVLIFIMLRCMHFMDTDASFLWQNNRHNMKFFRKEHPYEGSIKEFLITKFEDSIAAKSAVSNTAAANLGWTIHGLPAGINQLFKGSIKSELPYAVKDMLEYMTSYKLGTIKGNLGDYSDHGYYMKNPNQHQQVVDNLRVMNLTQLVLAQDVKAIVLAEQYYLAPYGLVFFREFVFEFPDYDITNYKLNIEVAKIVDKYNVEEYRGKTKEIFVLDMLILGSLFLCSIIIITCAKIDKQPVLHVFIFEIQFLGLALIPHLVYFEYYEQKNFDLDDLSYVKTQVDNEKFARSFFILLFLMQSFRTLGSGYLNFDITTILWVTNYIVYWIAPLVFLYALVICMLTFLAEPITQTFTDNFTKNFIFIFKIQCQSEIGLLTKILNESPNWFIATITVFEIVIFYFINNIYFGLQFENVRLLTDSRTNNYKQKMPNGEVKSCNKKDQIQGFWGIIMTWITTLTKQLDKKEDEDKENPVEEEALIKTQKK